MTAQNLLDRLRADGWTVAVHNDYRLHGRHHTFYLLTHPSGVWAKGEGVDDRVALEEASAQAARRLEMVRALSARTDAAHAAQPRADAMAQPRADAEAATDPSVVTDADRRRYPGHTDSVIQGIKLIATFSTEELLKAIEDEDALEAIRLRIGADTNPGWALTQIAEELCFSRQAIDTERLDQLTR